MSGWIKLHRDLVEWEWHNKPEMVALWVFLLLKANHQAQKWHGVNVDRGQVLTGLHRLNEQTGISIQTIRTCLNRLKSTGEITIKSTSRFSLITINKYDTYQIEETQSNKRTNKQTNKQLTNDQQTTNNKQEIKNDKNVRKRFVKPTAGQVEDYGKQIDFEVDGEYFIDYYERVGWKYKGNAIKDWRACVRTWKSRSNKKPVESKKMYTYVCPNGHGKLQEDNPRLSLICRCGEQLVRE